MKKLEKISVIIPIRTKGSAKLAIEALRQVDYPQELIEVFLVEGNQPARQRNEAAKEAQGDIVYFLDDDSKVEKDLFLKIIEIYENDKSIIAVGGPMLMEESSQAFWPKVFKNIFSSFFGVLGKRARYHPVGSLRQASEDEIILCNFSIKREIFIKENGFNEQLYPNEENELFGRLRKNNFKILYAPQAKVYRLSKASLIDFLKSIFNYGKGRA
ncbi:MAG: glycosyltransferase, partial [Candidatus Omnitrophota bacterium]